MPPKNKDPNKPKGRKTAYAFFLQEKRKSQKVAEKFAEFSRNSAAEWRNITADKKDKFYALQAEDKIRYDKEMEDYEPPMEEKGRRKKRKVKKDKNAPKRAMSGFMHFCAYQRPILRKLDKNKNATVGDLAKQLGALWKMMKHDQKKPFEESAAKDRDRYDEEMQAYRESLKQPAARAEEDDEEEDEDDEEQSSD